MRAIGIRELKNRLSEYLRHVRDGESVLVTDRGVVIAELRPPSSASDNRFPGLDRLAQRGMLDAVKENDPKAYRKMRRLLPAGAAKRALDEARGKR